MPPHPSHATFATTALRLPWSAPFPALHRPYFKRLTNNPKPAHHRTLKRRERRAPFYIPVRPSRATFASTEIASGSKLGIDATKKISGEGFKRPWTFGLSWVQVCCLILFARLLSPLRFFDSTLPSAPDFPNKRELKNMN